MLPSVFVQVVTYNSASFISACIESLLLQEGFELEKNLSINIIDNASSDNSIDLLTRRFISKISLQKNSKNLGFCAAHNQGAYNFLQSQYKYLLILNPDLKLDSSALRELVGGLESFQQVGSCCPKLLRADLSLKMIEPPRLDSAGMFLTRNLRHFDRDAGELDQGRYDRDRFVFGGSGACLLLRREFIEDVCISSERESDLPQVFPDLGSDMQKRAPLFDEAFFAFREDADLAWRGQNLGWKCLLCARALGYHVRSVTPERRAQLSRQINLAGVRNRFLLQLNNYSISVLPSAFMPGIIFRNLLVLLAVFLKERSSLPAIWHVLKLRRRALARRAIIFKKAKERNSFWRWSPN